MMKWENVHVFISSTFNDMHAERDFLLKKVFPELSEWMKALHLNLIDVDLRWGITEKDAQENKRVVEVCLERIDDCRPLFLCFLGQRRGWIPQENDISEDSFQTYPNLKRYVGERSVTELEIMHAVFEPLQHDRELGSDISDYCFFCHRMPTYLSALQHRPELLNIYSGERDNLGILDEIRERGLTVYDYEAVWDEALSTPELQVASLSAEELSQLRKGRLKSFAIDGVPLEIILLDWLKRMISRMYPDSLTAIQSEIAEYVPEDELMYDNIDVYIEQTEALDYLRNYIRDSGNQACTVIAPSGSGKTVLLNKFAQELAEEKAIVVYRSIGISEHTASENELISGILYELRDRHILRKDIPARIEDRNLQFEELLHNCSGQRIILIIDGLDQLSKRIEEMRWLPKQLPVNIKLIIGYKPALQETLDANWLQLYRLPPLFQDADTKRKYAKCFLKKYLKDIDDDRLELLINIPGTDNPLYLKIVLSELRVYGSFDQLVDKIQSMTYREPEKVFESVLERMEQDPVYCVIPPKEAVAAVLSALAYTKAGASVTELQAILSRFFQERYTEQECKEAVLLYFRQLRPYLGSKGEYTVFRYDSLRKAVQNRYSSNEDALHWACSGFYGSCLEVPTGAVLLIRAYEEYLYHLAFVDQQQLKAHLAEFQFIDRMLQVCKTEMLTTAYSYVQEPQLVHEVLATAFALSAYAIDKNHYDIPSQLWNRLCDIQEEQLKCFLDEMCKSVNYPWLKGLQAILPLPNSKDVQKIVLPGNIVKPVGDFIDDTHYFVVWTEGAQPDPAPKTICCGIVDLKSRSLQYRKELGTGHELPLPRYQISIGKDKKSFVYVTKTNTCVCTRRCSTMTGYLELARRLELEGIQPGLISPNMKYVQCCIPGGYIVFSLEDGSVIFKNLSDDRYTDFVFSDDGHYLVYRDMQRRNLYVLDIEKESIRIAFSSSGTNCEQICSNASELLFSEDSRYLLYRYSNAALNHEKFIAKNRGHSFLPILILVLKANLSKKRRSRRSYASRDDKAGLVVYDLCRGREHLRIEGYPDGLIGATELQNSIIVTNWTKIDYLHGTFERLKESFGTVYRVDPSLNAARSRYLLFKSTGFNTANVEYYDSDFTLQNTYRLDQLQPFRQISPSGYSCIEMGNNDEPELYYRVLTSNRAIVLPPAESKSAMHTQCELMVDIENGRAIPFVVDMNTVQRKGDAIKRATSVRNIEFQSAESFKIDSQDGMRMMNQYPNPNFCKYGGAFVERHDQASAYIVERYIGNSIHCYTVNTGIKVNRLWTSMRFLIKQQGTERGFSMPLMTESEYDRYKDIVADDISVGSIKRLQTELLVSSPVNRGIKNPVLSYMDEGNRKLLLDGKLSREQIAMLLNDLLRNKEFLRTLEKSATLPEEDRWMKSHSLSRMIRRLMHRSLLRNLYGITCHSMLSSMRVLAVDEEADVMVYGTSSGTVVQNLVKRERYYLPLTEFASPCAFVKRSYLIGIHKDEFDTKLRVIDYRTNVCVAERNIPDASYLAEVIGDGNAVYFASKQRVYRFDLDALTYDISPIAVGELTCACYSEGWYCVVDQANRTTKLLQLNGDCIVEHYAESMMPNRFLVCTKEEGWILYQGINRLFKLECARS